MNTRIPRKLGMKGRRQQSPLTHQHRSVVVAGENGDLRSRLGDIGGADKNPAQRLPLRRHLGRLDIRLERVYLTPERIANHADVKETQCRLTAALLAHRDGFGEQNHPGAGSIDRCTRPVRVANRIVQSVAGEQLADRRALSARKNQRVGAGNIVRRSRQKPLAARRLDRPLMGLVVPLHRDDTHARSLSLIIGQFRLSLWKRGRRPPGGVLFSLPATNGKKLFVVEQADVDAHHRLTEPGRYLCQLFRVVRERHRVDDTPGALGGITRFEDA